MLTFGRRNERYESCIRSCWAGLILPLAFLPIGVVHAQSSASAYTTGYRYDSFGRQTGVISPAANTTSSGPFQAIRNTYDAGGRLVKVESGSLSAWQSQSIDPQNWTGFTVFHYIATTYDGLGNKLTESTDSSSGSPVILTQYSYDAVGRLACTAERMNASAYATLPSDACSLGTAGSYGSDRVIKDVYDAAGQLVQIRRAVGTSIEQAYVTYAYSGNGKIVDSIDANGNDSHFVFDGFDRTSQLIFPSSTPATSYSSATQASALSTSGGYDSSDYEAYAYDSNGNRTSLRKRDGTVLTYVYDGLNRVTEKVVPQRNGLPATDARSVYFSYDLLGHELTAWFDSSSSGVGLTSSYDGFGRQISSTLAMDGNNQSISFQYDADNNQTKIIYPDNNYVTYAYDGMDRSTTITTGFGSNPASYSYNTDGTRASFASDGGSISSTYSYDSIDRLSGIANNPVNTIYSNSFGFGYSPAGQLISVSQSSSAFVFTGGYNVSRSYSGNGLNQYVTAGSANFSYDMNGNLTGDGTNNFLYDIENRLVGEGGGLAASLRYDPHGRLYEVVGPAGTTRFLYGGDKLLAEYDGSGNLLRRYVHGSDVTSDNPIGWYEGSSFSGSSERLLRANWQGSIGLVTDSSGSTIYAANTFDEYGIPGASNAGRFQYTGQAWVPEIGMYYYKARMYSPSLGRFMQTDPIGYKDDVDLYAYVANDPLDKTDFTGEAFGLDDLVGAGLGAVVGVGVELGKDAITGQEVTAGGLAGAAVGGAILAEGVVNAPETLGGSLVLAGAAKGAAAGAAASIVQQGVDNVSGAQKGFSPTSLAVSTAVGAVTGGLATKIPTTRVSGVTAGRGNFHAAAAGVRTRIANGNATRMSTGTAVRGAIGSQTGDAGRTGAGGVVSAVQGFVCKHTGFGC